MTGCGEWSYLNLQLSCRHSLNSTAIDIWIHKNLRFIVTHRNHKSSINTECQPYIVSFALKTHFIYLSSLSVVGSDANYSSNSSLERETISLRLHFHSVMNTLLSHRRKNKRNRKTPYHIRITCFSAHKLALFIVSPIVRSLRVILFLLIDEWKK